MYVPNALFYAGLVLDENSKTFLPDGWHHVEYPPQFETHINRVFFYDNQFSLSFVRSFFAHFHFHTHQTPYCF